MDEVKHLIEIDKYKNTKRKNDSSLVEWENSQLKMIKKNEWTVDSYVILAFYGEFSQDSQVVVTNRTNAPFDQ